MLSFAEFYKPKFFLLENVLGLLTHKLQINKPGPQEGEMVANGMIKFILRALTSLGYVARPLRTFCFFTLGAPTLTLRDGQLSGPLQRLAGRSLRVATESSPRHHLGRTARGSPS